MKNNNNYANLVARVLFWYMNYLQHPFSIYHILLLPDIDETLRLDVSRYVKKMVKSRDSIDIDSKFEKLTKEYDSNVEKYGKVQRGHYPLKYVKLDLDGKCGFQNGISLNILNEKNFFVKYNFKNKEDKSSIPQLDNDREDRQKDI